MKTSPSPRKKRVLHLITGLGVGGAEMMLLKTVPELQNHFDNQVCAIIGRGPIGKQLEEKGINVHYLEIRSLFDFGIIWRFGKVIREFQPDLIVTYLMHADLFGRFLGRLFGVKKIACSQRGSLLGWEYLRKVDRLTKYLVTRYITQTEYAKKDLIRKLNIQASKVSVVPNAIIMKEFEFTLNTDKVKKELGIPVNNLNLTCVANMRPGKGQEYLIQAFDTLYKSNPNLNLLLIGDGERKGELKALADTLPSHTNIHFLGHRDDVKEILRISDIFILPTLAEGMSNAILESMASGLASAVSDIPENQAIIQDGKNGILFPIKDSDRLAKILESLIRDKDLRFRLGKNARNDINEKYEISKVVLKLTELFNSI